MHQSLEHLAFIANSCYLIGFMVGLNDFIIIIVHIITQRKNMRKYIVSPEMTCPLCHLLQRPGICPAPVRDNTVIRVSWEAGGGLGVQGLTKPTLVVVLVYKD